MLVLVAVQQPRVEATVNRTSVEVGEEVIVTVRVRTEGGVTAQASVPPFSGFDLVGTSQSSTFTIRGGAGSRDATWEFRLRAVEAGPGVIGPIRVRVGSTFVDAGTLSVDIAAVGAADGGKLDARVADIIARAPGPGESDDVTVTLVASTDTLVLGEQLDLVVVAWFPRDIRSRLRTRPTLVPPQVQGAWTYPRTSALGVVDTRRVNGRLYDLYVHHQLAFPLTVGTLEVGRASVSYSLPLRTSILSREVPQEVQSESMTITVLPQPLEGRPQPYTGAAARDLEFAVDVEQGGVGLGQAITITATVTGRGNVALWPEPEFRWPEGVRVYPGRTDVQIVAEDGLIGGTKTFSYLIAPDSAGTFTIPAPTYSYFALDSARYVRATLQPIELIARGGRGTGTRATPPPDTMAPRGAPVPDRLASGVRLWMILLLLGFPPLAAVLVRFAPLRRWRPRPKRKSAVGASGMPTLDRLDQEFRSKLERLVPGNEVREGDGLPAALRAAGVEASLATHACRVRDRLRGAVYGRDGASDPEELAAEVREVLRALPGGAAAAAPRVARGTRGALVAVCLSLCGVVDVAAQSPSAEQLFIAGAYQAAADSFRFRADSQPAEAAHWFNVGAALVGAGQPTRARVVWIKAARILPRDPAIKQALATVPPFDAAARRSTWVAPVTVTELAWLAAALWVLGWVLFATSRWRRRGLVILAGSILLASSAAYLQRRYATPVALVVVPNAPLRDAPYGTSRASRQLALGTAVKIERQDGSWALVSRGEGAGWMLLDELGRL